MHLQVVQIVTFVIAFALAATRVLTASKPFWNLFPAWLAGILPGLVVAIPALGQAVAGAQSWTDLTVAFLTAGALLLPGAHSHSVGSDKPSKPPLAVVSALGLLALVAGVALCVSLSGCAAALPAAKAADQAAVLLCDDYFSLQHPGISLHDIESAFCTAASDIEPFLAQAKAAEAKAGAEVEAKKATTSDAGAGQ